MVELIGRRPIKLYQAKVISVEDTRADAQTMEIKLSDNQAWGLVIDRVKNALLRDLERHIELCAMNRPDGTILAEAAIWIEVPDGGADG